jgi:hypothetical protein
MICNEILVEDPHYRIGKKVEERIKSARAHTPIGLARFLTVRGDTVSIERGDRRSEAQRRRVSIPSLVLGSAFAFLIRRSL